MKRMLLAAATVATAGAAALAHGCGGPIVVTCDPARNGAECLQGGISGECVGTCDDAVHYCAFAAPHDCPATGLAYGVLSGDYSATCVETCALPDGGVGQDASTSSDAGLDAPSTVYVSLSATNSMQVFEAQNLTSLGTVSLPPTQPQGYALFAVDHDLWMVSQQHVVKYGLDTNLVAAGYPRYFGNAGDCQPATSVFGPEGWTCIAGSTVQRWTGEPLAESLTRSASSPDYLARSAKRIFSIEGDQAFDKIVVYDALTLNAVPGSPISIDQSRGVFADSELDRIVVVSWQTAAPGLYLFRESTLEPLGYAAIDPATFVSTVGFDTKRHTVLAAMNSGFLAEYSDDDLSLVTAPTSVASTIINRLGYDASRDRIYATAGSGSGGALIVLDAGSLAPVTGSPVPMVFAGQSLVLR